MEYKDSYIDSSDQSGQRMKYVKAILLTMCKIKKYNLTNNRTAKIKQNSGREQHHIFSHITKCKNTFERAVLTLYS